MRFLFSLFIVICFSLGLGHASSSLESPVGKRIPLSSIWATDFHATFAKAQQEKKILVVAFLGHSWCPWSEKLKEDVLNSPLFIGKLQEIACFAVVKLDQGETKHNKQLRKVFHVDQSPTLVLFDYSQEEIARLGFLPHSAERYADQILELAQNFEEVLAFLKDPQSVTSEKQMKQIYAKAKKLSSHSYGEKILEIGLKKEKGSFFILEKYACLLDKSKFKSPVVQKTRHELIKKDPKNQEGTRLTMAVLEFQKFSSRVKRKNQVFRAITPLIGYVREFGKADGENLWKIEMMIAQFLLAQNEYEMALEHAQASLEAAPDEVSGEIEEIIDYIQRRQ